MSSSSQYIFKTDRINLIIALHVVSQIQKLVFVDNTHSMQTHAKTSVFKLKALNVIVIFQYSPMSRKL